MWPFSNNEVVFRPNLGKNSYMPTNSFRPISESSYIGKLLCRIIKNRTVSHLHEHNLENPSQEAFRKHRSTARYIDSFIASFLDCWSENLFPLALIVDRKLFDSVWIAGLTVKMHYLGIISNTCCLIKKFRGKLIFTVRVVDSRAKNSKLLWVCDKRPFLSFITYFSNF